MLQRGTVVAGLSIASCTFLFLACSSSDAPNDAKPDGGASSGTPGTSSSGTNPGSSSGGDGGDLLPDGAPADAGLVPVGDGSLGAGCNTDDECHSKICSVGHACVQFPSCRPSTGTAAGVDTCGAANANDSCCTTLTLPTTTMRTLDKYEITAGRIRAFIADIKQQNLGVPNIRKFAKDYAAAHPGSQLDQVVQNYPAKNGLSAYIDLLPDHDGTTGDSQLPVWLGAFPADAYNNEDGCFVGPDGYGAATYWQDSATLKAYLIGYGDPNNPDGMRKFPQSVYDAKPQNCTAPIMLAAFCAWDGGELAETTDYHEVWGHQSFALPTADGDNGPAGAPGVTVWLPWATVLAHGDFNWGNGHAPIPCPQGWPGCNNVAEAVFFASPSNDHPEDDDAPEIAEPGRFPKDVTKITSPDGAGWYDVGGNLLEAAWPNISVASTTQDFCDTSTGKSNDPATQCQRKFQNAAVQPRDGTLRFKGATPTVSLIGYSFEVHSQYSEPYFADVNGASGSEASELGIYTTTAHFQYGKLGGRCARVK